MTEKELSKYYHLKQEVEDLEKRIAEFGDGVKSNQFEEISVSGSHSNKSIQEKKAELISMWQEKRICALEEYLRIERYIENVEDIEIRKIMRYRFMDLKTWEQIGDDIHEDRTTVSKKIRRFLKHSHNSH